MGELTHLKWNCSDPLLFNKVEQEACSRLAARDYPPWSSSIARKLVANKTRDQLMHGINKHKKVDQSSSAPIAFATTYSPQYNNIVKIIKKHLPILRMDDKLDNILAKSIQYVAEKAPISHRFPLG